MFSAKDILYEDNHLLLVNKHCGDLVQPDSDGNSAMEDQIKAFIKRRDSKPGDVFLGVVHRIDRPVSGVVIFAKTSKALVRLNEMIRDGKITKLYWAAVEGRPENEEMELRHYMGREAKTNKAKAYDVEKKNTKLGRLEYTSIHSGTNYTLLEVRLFTGRHHQIRAQLSKIGCPIRGDIKYGSKRTNKSGGISLHSRRVIFEHPVKKEPVDITAPLPTNDSLWVNFKRDLGV